MPKRRPPYLSGHFYHVYNRGRSRLSIFHRHEDYVYVLQKLKEYSSKFRLTLIAYCLMPNHYHFLIRQDGDVNAGVLPQRVFNSYAKLYNHRYEHSGTLFEDNYDVKLVDKPAYLLHLCRYIHANPVKDAIVARVEDWLYSNYLEWIGARAGTLVDRAFVQAHFETATQYIAFVEQYVRTRQLPADIQAYVDRL